MNERVSERRAVSRKAIEKVSSRIVGLDAVQCGGLPKGRMTLPVGRPGTGKTIVALEFLYRSAPVGDSGRRAEAIRADAAISMRLDRALYRRGREERRRCTGEFMANHVTPRDAVDESKVKKITIRARPDDAKMRIDISDAGPGLPGPLTAEDI